MILGVASRAMIVALRGSAPFLLVVVLWLARERVMDLVYPFVGLGPTSYAVIVLGVWPERLAAAVVLAMLLAAAARVPSISWESRASSWRPIAGVVALAMAPSIVLGHWLGAVLVGAVAGVVTAAATVRAGRIEAWVHGGPRPLALWCFLAIGAAEVLTLRPLVIWMRQVAAPGAGPIGHRLDRFLRRCMMLGVIPLAFGLTLPFAPLVALDRAVLRDPRVAVVASGPPFSFSSGDFTWLAVDQRNRRLIACGSGQPRFAVFGLGDLRRLEFDESIETGRAQFCGYDADRGEVLVYSTISHHVIRGDADTFVPRDSTALELPVGEVWIDVDPGSETILVASEAAVPGGADPIALLDRATLEVRSRLDVTPGYVLRHPRRPVVYIDSFNRRAPDLLRVDIASAMVTHSVRTDGYVDRMAFNPARDEILVASPLQSRVQRFDANDLTPRGALKVAFGTRAVAVDTVRNLMLTGSFALRNVEVFDLVTGSRLARFRLGPWLRSIVVDEADGVAYVSSLGALYRVDYAAAASREAETATTAKPGIEASP